MSSCGLINNNLKKLHPFETTKSIYRLAISLSKL